MVEHLPCHAKGWVRIPKIKFVFILFAFLHNGFKYGAVAQLGEHLPCKQRVEGSNPFSSTHGYMSKLERP